MLNSKNPANIARQTDTITRWFISRIAVKLCNLFSRNLGKIFFENEKSGRREITEILNNKRNMVELNPDNRTVDAPIKAYSDWLNKNVNPIRVRYNSVVIWNLVINKPPLTNILP